MSNRRQSRRPGSASWEGVADWYAGWSGPTGSRFHKRLAIPLLLNLLDLRTGDTIADLGCGPGTLTAAAHAAGVRLTGIDLSPRLISMARKAHGERGRFLVGDAARVQAMPSLRPSSFDAASFLLSLQDIDPLDDALASAAWLLRPGGRLGIVMLHPCFRIPRQSGWGWDDGRSLQYRRIDSYLSPLAVPMQEHADGRGVTRSYHRPLSRYVSALASCGLVLTALEEIADFPRDGAPRGMVRAERRARAEFPLFIGLRAEKPG